MLDLGANIDSTAENLFQFAIMGSCLYSNQFNKDKPSVGLLNIGSEKTKGNETLKLTVDYLSNSNLNFYGNVEGDDIFYGKTDVVVCDGFSGNISLKTAEGVASMIKDFLKKEFSSSIRGKIASMLIYPELLKFKKKIDPRVYNGAALIGLNGVVFKSHGNTDIFGFESALDKALKAIKNKLNDKIKTSVLTKVNNSNVQ
jgi:glycerol-3-phosphate acyltransferase PlsX